MAGYDDIIAQMKQSQSSTGTAPVGNPYDDAVSQLRQSDENAHAQAALAISMSSAVNADRAAQNAQLAKRYKTTPEVVDKFPDEFRSRMVLEDARSTLKNAPALQARINANPSIAGVIHDDIGNAAAIEQVAKNQQYMSSWDGPEEGPTLRERASNYWRKLFGMQSVAEERRGQREAEATAILASRQPGMTDDQAWEASRQAVGGMSQIPQVAAERFADSATFGLVAPTNPTKTHSWQASTAGAVGQLGGFVVGPARAAGVFINPLERVAGESFIKGLSKSTINEAATLALASAAEKGGHALLDTHSSDEAAKIEADALSGGALTGAAFGSVKKLFPDNTIPQWIARAMGVTAAQDALEGTNPLDERIPLEDRLFKYFLNAAFTLHGGGRSEGGWLRDVAEAKVAENDYHQLSSIGQLSAAAKWRERDPEGFKGFIKSVTEDGHLEHVYVNGEVFAQALDKAGVGADELRAKMPELAAQIVEALHTKGDVRMSTADYATHIAGGPADAELLQHLKTDPEGKTYAEAKQLYQEQAERMKEATTKLVSEKAQIDKFRESTQAVQDKIHAQLDDLGRFPTDVNKVYSTVQASILARVAAKEGITPEQAFEKYGAKLAGQGVEGFDQTAYGNDLLAPLGESRMVGEESLLADYGDVKAFESDYKSASHRSIRYVKYDAEGNPIGVLQFRTKGPRSKKGEIQNIYTVDAQRRTGVASGLLRFAQQHFDIKHSNDLTRDGAAFKAADGKFYQVVDRPLPEGTTHVEMDGKQRSALNSNGQPIAATEEGVRNFWRWFGDSKVVDADGKPLVVYHGTDAKFTKIDLKKGAQGLFWFTSDKAAIEAGDVGASGKGVIMELYAKIDNPAGWKQYDQLMLGEFKSRGLDGAVLPESDGSLVGFVMRKDENQIKSATGNNGEFDPKNPNILKQDARGSFNPDTSTIALLKDADLSTYLHETGHWALDTYAKIALSPEASPDIRGDMDKLLNWFGVESIEKWNSMSLDEQRPYHEQFARGFEAYLMEGKAPSLELQPLFSRIRAWMVNIYQALRNLNVELSPEVRGVFDRMIASEEEINQAQAARVFEPLFKTKPEGMTDEEWADYVKLGQSATDQAIDDMQAKSLRDLKWVSGAKSRALKEMQAKAKSARDAVKSEVEAEVDQQPVYAAERFLRKGETVAENGDIIAVAKEGRPGAKLNTARIKEMFPETALDHPDLAKLKGMTGPKGLDPDLVADMFGFRSGEELVRNLIDMEPRASVVEGLTDRRMLEEHGELATPAGLEAAASAAIHNDARARFVATGLKVLTKSAIPARELLRGAREAAEGAIAARKVRDLNPRQYEAAETKSNKEALKLVAKDPAGAVQAQRASLLNNQLVKSTRQALDDVAKGIEYFKKLDKPTVRERIDVAFRDQIDQLLARYDLRTSLTPEQAFEKNLVSLETFVEKLAAMKFSVDVPESMIVDANRMHYKDMTVEQFRGLVDAVKSLDHLGRAVQKITDGEVQRELADVAMEAVAQTANLPKREAETNRGLSRIAEKWIGAKSFGRSIQASLLKMEQMIDWLDDYNPNGVFNRMVFRKIADAEGRRNDLDLKISQAWEAHVAQLPRELLKNNRGSLEMPGVIDGLTGQTQRLTWGEKIALAGIRGDAQHFSKLLKGEKWDAQAVLDFLDKNMTKEEWAFVKGLADTFQEIFPLKQQMLRDLGSTAPKEVERIPFGTPHGEQSGWYWPITYDPARSHSVKERHAKHEASLFEDNIYTRADTSTGREQTRNDNYAKPMLLSIDVLPRVLKDEIRDITTRKAIIEADRFLSHPDVRKSITSVLSTEHYDTFNGWLLSLANDANVRPSELQMWDRVMHEIRTRTTMVGLGFRVSTMVMHGLTAAGESVAEAGPKAMMAGILNKKTWSGLMGALGPEWMNKGLENFIRDDQFVANRDFIFERSAEMRHRANELERDVREQLQAIHLELMDPATSAAQRAKLAITSRAYQGIAMLDMASAMPTWMGAYLKGMTPESKGGLGMSEEDAVYFADKTLRNAHGGGGVKDMAMVQRGNETFKLFTMFYTFWNHNINRIMDTGKRLKNLPRTYSEAQESGDWAGFRGDVGTLVLRTFMYTLGTQAIHHMMHPPKEDEQNPEGWLEWFGKQMALSVSGGVPLARDVVAHYFGGKDYEMSPVAALVSSTDRTLKDADNPEQASRFIKHAMTTAGYILGMPLGQPASTTQFLSDVWTGHQSPQDITEWWRGLTTGDATKH